MMARIINGGLNRVTNEDLVEGHYSTPTSVTMIEPRAFKDCTKLTSITLPAGLTRIESWAFEDCAKLTSITLPAGLTRIEDVAFKDCTGLTSIILPAGLTKIGIWVFKGCTGLTSITLPAGLTGIHESAFENCWQLQVITIQATDKEGYQRVKALLPEELQSKAVPSGVLQKCIQAQKDALDRLKRNPKISPLYGLFQQGVFGKNFSCDVISIVSQYEEPSTSNYKAAKEKILTLPYPLNEQGLEGYVAQLNEIISKSGGKLDSGHGVSQKSLPNSDFTEEKSAGIKPR